LNFVEDRERVKGTQLRFQVIGREPYSVAVGFAGVRSASLTKVGAHAFTKGHELFRIGAELVGKPDDNFEVGEDAGLVSRLLDEL